MEAPVGSEFSRRTALWYHLPRTYCANISTIALPIHFWSPFSAPAIPLKALNGFGSEYLKGRLLPFVPLCQLIAALRLCCASHLSLGLTHKKLLGPVCSWVCLSSRVIQLTVPSTSSPLPLLTLYLFLLSGTCTA